MSLYELVYLMSYANEQMLNQCIGFFFGILETPLE